MTEEDQGRSRDMGEEYPFVVHLPLTSKSLDITLFASDASSFTVYQVLTVRSRHANTACSVVTKRQSPGPDGSAHTRAEKISLFR